MSFTKSKTASILESETMPTTATGLVYEDVFVFVEQLAHIP